MYGRAAPPVYMPGQPYPGQPYPGQPYPGQPFQGPPRGMPPPTYAQAYPPQPYPGYAPPPQGFAMGPLPPHLSAFTQHYNSDESWNCRSSDAAKEMGLIQNRKNDLYPQGRDNCLQFLRECQNKGLSFKVKACKSSPYWTWYFELDGPAAPSAPVGYSGGYTGVPYGLAPNLAPFTQHYNADESWNCRPSDAAKELGLIQSRKNDMYPQGRDNCIQFLRECQNRNLSFKVKACKTHPYWTWYFEVDGASSPAGYSGGGYSGGYSGLPYGLSPNLSAFLQHVGVDESWKCGPSDAAKEMGLLQSRVNDSYPQGRDLCMQFLRECQQKNIRFMVKAKKTHPHWTWYYEVDN